MSEQHRSDGVVPDPRVGEALRWLEGEPPVEAVDWGALRTAVRSRSELELARRRRGARRSVPRWARPLVPLAAAAGIATMVWLGGEDAASPPALEPGATTLSVEEALHEDLSEQEFRLLVSGRADPDELLRIAAGER